MTEANKFYQPGEQRAEKVNDLFGAIASRYDLINDLQSFGLHRYWKRRLLAMARVKAGDRALDVCCGTGDIAFALRDAGADVTGLDFSEPMLGVARERSRKNSDRLQFVQGDAMRLPFPDNSFDIVTVGYGLRNLVSWEQGLEEMKRVARPGGRILVLDFGKPRNPLWRGIYFAGLKFIVPIFGKIFCQDSATYSYILVSLREYPAQEGVLAKLKSLGCADIQEKLCFGGAMSLHCATVVK